MTVVEHFTPSPKNWEVYIANLRPQKWLSSEISDSKTWHSHPRMQTWQVPWVFLEPSKFRRLLDENVD